VSESPSASDRVVVALRRAALRHPDVEESVACKGTPIESATFKIGGRAFLFLRSGRVMVRLDRSQEEAAGLAQKKPERYKIGSGGWATVTFEGPKDVSIRLLERWVSESYGVLASGGASRKAKHK
jgi:hypothetical protein